MAANFDVIAPAIAKELQLQLRCFLITATSSAATASNDICASPLQCGPRLGQTDGLKVPIASVHAPVDVITGACNLFVAALSAKCVTVAITSAGGTYGLTVVITSAWR